MRDLYARAHTNLSLTPGERALLKLIEGLLCAGLVAALPLVAGALGHAGIQWGEVGRGRANGAGGGIGRGAVGAGEIPEGARRSGAGRHAGGRGC